MESSDRVRACTDALDASDWDGFRACLTSDCVYIFRGEVLEGAEPIVDMYRSIGEWVSSTFDAVRYESTFQKEGERSFRISFRDLIDHAGHHLDFRCEQVVRVGSHGLIDRIVHFDLPGEAEKAARFNELCGVNRPGPTDGDADS